jgi:uncharacterized membrane protein YphA (DoxX/SURF4 family)
MIRRFVQVARVVLGLTFLYAAFTKLQNPWELFALSIDSYGLLPEWAVIAVARTLPWLEGLLGLLLISGLGLVSVSGATSLLLVVFLVMMVRAYWLGLGIDCGCFGIGEAISTETLLRDGALTLLSVGVTVGAIVVRRGARRAAEDAAPGPT